MKRLAIIMFFLLCFSALQARTYIVCVGIADYPGRQNDLRVSANDAKTISGIFTKNGNATVDCFVNSDVTIKKVCTAMRNTFAKASPSDAIILYFSGHGVPGGLVCYDGFLYYSSVLSIMKQSKARQKMIFVDACFAGKMRNTNKRNTNYSKENVMFFLSSRSTVMASLISESGHSFSRILNCMLLAINTLTSSALRSSLKSSQRV